MCQFRSKDRQKVILVLWVQEMCCGCLYWDRAPHGHMISAV